MRNYFLLFALFIIPQLLPAQVQQNNDYSGKSAYINGLEAFENEAYEEARELLLEAYRNLDQPPGVSYALADTYLSLNDLPNAAVYGKQAVEADPESKWYRLKLAEIYRSAGRNQATLEQLNTLLEYHPNDFEGLYMLADTYKDYGEFVRSNEILDRIIKLSGEDPQVLLMKFRNFESLAATDSAVVQLERIREADPDNLQMLNLLGQYYSRTGEKAEAKKVLKDALDRNARDPQSLITLSTIYLEEQQWDSAGTLLTNFISDTLIQPENKMEIARFFYSRVEQDPQNIQLRVEAERIFDTFTESEPEFGPAFTLSGEYYRQAGEPEIALEKLEQANKLLPGDDIAWRQRLQLLLSQQKYEETIEVGLKANEEVPEDAFIQFFIGSGYMLNDQNKKAEPWLEQAARAPARRPFKSVIYSTLGDVRANLENHEASDEAYELALRYDPDNDNAMNNYAYNLSVRGENLERAKELALKAIEVNPENSAYLDTVGWVYYKLGDYDRAQRFIKASIDTGEASAEVLEHMGDVNEKLGNMEEARDWWRQALEKDPDRTHLEPKING
ncbi:tetratricopeptide repeat protein [Gracilimonas mengyeensis]|uniref:Tetratricopeptide repeat-containing protein n=1 Tax=Gracilimonas mengyeensis TaxID=1302730 RepID=A0A521CEZ0_9BACT|nr:tetratricopeptide repeat protein [Gracilimonas mengyeensis]SMO57330.1 Tetratricopeptide repeat-containing protein [Gracilimonas mengyeensis]